jgi:peptidoglycan/xylan/chitin deacetylase (PgdA/CDA1 family)
MPRDVDYCVNHPDVAATDSCERCGRMLCYNCQVRFFGKTYCGVMHLLSSIPGQARRGIRFFAHNSWKAAMAGFRLTKKMPKHGWIEIFLALGLAFSAIQVFRLNRKVQQLGKPSGITDLKTQADTSGLYSAKPSAPGKGGMVSMNKIEVAGRAEENRIVMLLADGRLMRVQLPEAGRFRFDGVLLHRGQNKVEVRALTPDGDVAVLETLILNYGAPTISYLLRNFSRGPLDKKEVAFTFDGGSIANAATDILNSLKAKGVKGTFFLTGEFIQKYPDLVRRIVAEGHDVGNHTWSHPHLTSFERDGMQVTLPNVTAETLRMELSKTAALFRKVTGRDMLPIWRAPYGEVNSEMMRWAAEAGHRHIGWTTGRGWEENMDTLDWVADRQSKVYRSADEIAGKILASAKKGPQGINGAVILMHLGTERKEDFPHQKLPHILDGLMQDGYRLVKVSDMFSEPL